MNGKIFTVVLHDEEIKSACMEFVEKRMYLQRKQLSAESGTENGEFFVNVFVEQLPEEVKV